MSKLDRIDMAAVMQGLDLAAPEAALISRNELPSEALDGLEKAGSLEAALRLVAHCLPRREAVWWACMCARHTAPPDLSARDLEALAATEEWVWTQADDERRAAFALAEEGGFHTPEAWVAVAAFWSGDSLGPAKLPAIAPPAHLTPIAVAGAIGLAATRGDGCDVAARQRAFLWSARDIGAGGPGRLAHETEVRR